MAKKEVATFKATGLHTYADVFSSTMEGSMSQAVNVVIDKDGIIEPRRGFSNNETLTNSKIYSMYNYVKDADNKYIVAMQQVTPSIDMTWNRYTGSSWSGIGYQGVVPQLPPSGANTSRTANVKNSLFFTGDEYVGRISENVIKPVGIPEPRINYVVEDTGAAAGLKFLAVGDSVKYKIVIAREDESGSVVLGKPSVSEFYTNPSGSVKALKINLSVVGNLLTTDTIQVYRTEVVTGIIVPDEYFLVDEFSISALPNVLDRSKGAIGTPLYTNSTQDGPTQENGIPPICRDITLFNNYTFYADCKEKAITRFFVSNLTAGSGAQITVEGVTYTEGSQFTGNASIEVAARDLISALSTSTYRAFYDSSPDDAVQGAIRLEEIYAGSTSGFPGNTISVSANNSIYIGNINYTASIEKHNRIYYSKIDQPEAVPALNYFDVGPTNTSILRIVPLRTSLLIFTTNGLYKLTGTFENQFQLSLVDSTIRLEAPDSLAVVDNIVYGLFDTGILAVNDTGGKQVSRRIDDLIKDIQFKTDGFYISSARGISYESDNKYILVVPDPSTYDSGDQKNDLQIIYNIQTNTFTTWNKTDVLAGVVYDGDGKLYLGRDTSKIIEERKDRLYTDYSDEDTAITINSVSDLTLTLASTPSDLAVGDIIVQGANHAKVVSIDGTDVVVDGATWTAAAATALKSITTTMVFNPISANSPSVMKQWSEANILMNSPFEDAIFSFYGHNSQSYGNIDVTGTRLGGWGMFPWGQAAWGGGYILDSYRTYVPRDKQRSPYQVFKIIQNTGYNKFQYAGISLIYRPIGSRIRR